MFKHIQVMGANKRQTAYLFGEERVVRRRAFEQPFTVPLFAQESEF